MDIRTSAVPKIVLFANDVDLEPSRAATLFSRSANEQSIEIEMSERAVRKERDDKRVAAQENETSANSIMSYYMLNWI